MKSLFIFLFLSLSTVLFGQVAVTENEPNALVEGIVNVITGDLYALEDDIVIAGVEPLRLKRSYISAKGEGKWSFFENLYAILRPPIKILTVNEPNGTALIYRYDQKANKKKKKHKKKKDKKKEQSITFRPLDLNQDAKGLTNTARGKISAQTNLKNQYVSMDKDMDAFTIVCPNGAKRTYRAISGQKPDKIKNDFGTLKIHFFYHYLLHSEELPNGNKILYQWHKNRLQSIRTTDPSGQKTYAQASFHYHGKSHEEDDLIYWDNLNFDVHTNDGRTLQYHYFCEGKPKKGGAWYLERIFSSDSPDETMHYFDRESYRNPILGRIALPDARSLHINYYNTPENSIGSRVHTLSSPVGKDASALGTHEFHYHVAERKTCVTDAEGTPTYYHWDDNLHLSHIDRFQGKNVYCSTVFSWGGGQDAANLLCKIFCDEQQRSIYATRYVYDARGNVLLEKFYGNLTGQGASLALDSNSLPIENGVESCDKRFEYSQDGKELLLRKEETNGLTVTYAYLSGTDLISAEISYDHGQLKRRKFYDYNGDRILVREITDDGNTADRNNLSGVTTRLIKAIHPKPDSPFLGMPQVIEERYWDGHGEKLLKKTVLHYDTGGRIGRKEIYDAAGAFSYVLIYKHDGKGNVTEETNALGQIAFSGYDNIGNKTFFQDVGGRVKTYMGYDYSNRLVELREVGDDGCTHVTTHDYDRKHNKVLTVDPYGHETRYIYNSQNQLIETHFPAMDEVHPVIHSTYDAGGREITRTDAKGYTTQTSYNAYGKPISIHHPDDTEERFVYYLDGNLRTHIDQNGVETAYTYDAFDRVTSIAKNFHGETCSQESFVYSGFHLIAKTDAEGNTTTYEYDGAGRKVAEELGEERIEYGYDALGRLHRVVRGELVTITEYDLLDQILEERREDLQGNVLSKVVYTYDSSGNRKTTTRFIDGKEATEWFEYDSFNRLVKKQDAPGNVTTIIHDDREHSKTTIDPLGLQTLEVFNSHDLVVMLEKRSVHGDVLIHEDYAYDANENLIGKQTHLFQPMRSVTTRWDYGPLDRLQTLTEATGTAEQKTTQYTDTPTGKLSQTIKPSGIILTNTYDPLDHLASQVSSDSSVNYAYVHDRLGRLIKSSDHIHRAALVRTYDLKGRLLSETLPNQLLFQNCYDAQGRRVRLDLPDSSFIVYSYNPLHLYQAARYTSSGVLAYVHTYTNYDLAGNVLQMQLIGNAGTVVRGYDLANRPTSLISPHFSHEVLAYDPVGNILQSRLDGEMLEYAYDDLYQLISEKGHTYSYDALHNRLQKDTAAYSVNALNQLPSEFKYNEDGNPISHDNVRYIYDALDRLICVETEGRKVQFTYDSYHRRISKTISGNGRSSTLFFLYDGQNEIGAVDASGKTQELRILGRTPQAEIGSSIAIELQGKVFAPLHDLYGNIAVLVSLSDQGHEHYHYTAFGEEKNPQPTLNPWRFSSKRTDNETSLVYFGRRYYFPTYGRWMTADPLGFDAGPNLYAYVSNAPLTHVDLYGLLALYNKQVSTEDLKQMTIGSVHAFGDFAMNTASAFSAMGWGLTTPFRAVNWMTGKSSFSQDWGAFQRSNSAFQEFGRHWMQRMLPGNPHNETYRAFRSGVGSGMELGAWTLGGLGAAKSAYSLVQKGFTPMKGFVGLQKIGRPADAGMRGNALRMGRYYQEDSFINKGALKIGRFTYSNTAAKHLTEFVKKGPNAGRLVRPYMKSQLTIEEIIAARKPISDPGGIPGGLRWDVPGALRGNEGTWELVMHPETNVIYHFNFK